MFGKDHFQGAIDMKWMHRQGAENIEIVRELRQCLPVLAERQAASASTGCPLAPSKHLAWGRRQYAARMAAINSGPCSRRTA